MTSVTVCPELVEGLLFFSQEKKSSASTSSAPTVILTEAEP
ncbi:hypothetical protein FHS31_001076 [Sphingomonas vulcanisoli]|uniref:Uncharacterized protein n=1 Tax=Sphingomonas vulcanisoli TaxID=1658060 RepID=A0ABX0TUN5_9SPHN|nr:hypothetical protein [Sphingomonas vulcanisoli]NIJ07480.1 hypothetical protein [Sphingomonas vulcanisoli]